MLKKCIFGRLKKIMALPEIEWVSAIYILIISFIFIVERSRGLLRKSLSFGLLMNDSVNRENVIPDILYILL